MSSIPAILDALKVVQGAVASKQTVPVLTHFHIYNGRVQGTNGQLCIDAPLPELSQFDVTVPAVPFTRAIKACKGAHRLNVTPTGRLSIRTGTFRALLPLLPPETFPRTQPQGVPVTYGPASIDDKGTLLHMLKLLRPFVSEDASRQWSRAVLIQDGYAYATNNIVCVRLPFACSHNLTIPAIVVDELLRIGEEPSVFYTSDNRISFGYPNKVWMSATVVDQPWPDVAVLIPEGVYPPVPEQLAAGVEEVAPFCEDKKMPVIHFNEHGISTSQVGTVEAQYNAGSFNPCAFRLEPLRMVLEIATELDLTRYPKPCPFNGEHGVQGVLVGVRI